MARHEAVVENADELRMGSPKYGRLILDGKEFVTTEPDAVESESLLWSDDSSLLAVQEVDYAVSYPGTRVVVINADLRTLVAASHSLEGLCIPLRFEDDAIVYRHWHHKRGEQ